MEEISNRTRTRYMLTLIILITIPCYLLGVILLRLNRGPQVATTATPTLTSTMTFIWRHLARNAEARRELVSMLDDREKLTVAVDELLHHFLPFGHAGLLVDMPQETLFLGRFEPVRQLVLAR